MSASPMVEQADVMRQANGYQIGQGNVFTLRLATVKEIKDDQNLNRVKCLPLEGKDNEMTDWCYVMTPMSGAERGLFLFPQVDDLVVLGYLESDPHRPIVLGGFWTADSKPPVAIADGKAEDYCFITPNKVKFTLHDEDKKQKLTFTMPSEITMEIDDENQLVTTKNKGGDTSLQMNMKDGEIELKVKKKLTITVGNASVTLEDSGNITIKGTGGDISIEGNSIAGKSQGSLSLEGVDVDMKANMDLNINAMKMASVKGTILKLN